MSDFAKKKEESDKRIQEALEARKKRKETEENLPSAKKATSDSKIEAALASRSQRMQSSLPSVMSDIKNLLTVEIDSYNSTKPSYGTYDSTYENQRERRIAISNLRSKINAYRNHMEAGAADTILSVLENMEKGYDSYLSMSRYESEDAFNKAVEQHKASEKARAELLSFDLEAGSQEIEHLERVLKEYDTLTRYDHGEKGLQREEELRNEYGSVKDLKGLITEKKSYLNQAKYLQETTKMSSVNDPNAENYDPEFDKYTGYKSTMSGEFLGRPISVDEDYETVNHKKSDYNVSLRNADAATTGDTDEQKWINTLLRMNEEEVSIYNYYYAKYGKDEAAKYLDSIVETINRREAEEIFRPLEDNIALELAFGFAAGLDQFESGIKNFLNTEDDYIPSSAIQMASGMVREDLADDSIPIWYNFKTGQWENQILGNSVGQVGYDSITTTANMLPSIIASKVVGMLNPTAGQIVGSGLMGMSAAGNAYQEMLNLGYDKGQARWYSTLVGASEAGLQYLLGGIGKMGGKLSGAAITKILDGVDNAFARIAIQLGGKMASEGIEEGLQEVLTPWFKKMALHIDEDINWSEVAYSTLLGSLTSLFMEGGETVTGEVAQQAQYYKTGKTIKQADGGEAALKKLADDVYGVTSADMQKKLGKQMDKVNKKATSTRLGKLYDTVQTANNQANASANQSDITKSLVRKGFSSETASDIAGALVASYNGQALTNSQRRLLKSVQSNKYVREAVSNIMENTSSTMGQRSQNIRDFQGGIYKGMVEKAVVEAVRKDTTAKQFAVSGEYDVSDSGRAINTETDDEIDIKGVSSIRNGEMILELTDGSTINASSVSFASESDAFIYEAVANLGDKISPEAANKLIAKYDGSKAEVFARGIAQAYTYGFYGIDRSELLGVHSLATELTTEQRNFAYGLGEQYRSVKDQADKAKARLRKAPGEKGVYYRDKDGNVTDIRSYLKKDRRVLNEIQTTGIEFMEKMSEMMGVRFNVFESWEENGKRYYLDENGQKTEGNPNGFYDPRTGEIYIDLFAGKDFQGTMLFTVAHELTHFMRQWSPEHFTKISKLVFSHAGFKGSVSSLVADKMNGKRKLDYDTALEEVVADGMETILKDGKVAEFMADVKKTHSKVWAKLKEWFKNFADFLKKMVNAYSGQSAQTVEGQKVADFSKKLLSQIEQIWAEGALSAGENYHAALENVVEENAEAVSSDEIITDGAVVTDGDGTKFSIKSMKHDIAEGQMFEDLKTYCGWTQKQVNELRQNLENLVEYMTPNRSILDMNETYGMEGRRFSPYKPNSDPLYKISMDFSTLCSKRLLTQYVIENLQLREDRPMSAEEQMAIRDMLNEYRKVEKGLQVACAMCYVEAARLKSPKQIQRWLNDPEPLLRDYFGKKNKEFNDSVKEAQADFKESRGYARNATKKDMKPADVKELNKIGPKLRSKYQLSAEEQAIIDKAKTLPNSTYLTAGNLSDLSETDPVIYDAYTAFVRSATRSKSLETDEPYYYGDSRRDNGNGIVVSDSFIEAVNRENGMRFSSWSDWRIQHLLDYITAVIDNSVRGAAMHGYTKFGEEVRVLGKTGMMFNMSGVAGTQTGLNEDGSLNFSPTESIDVNEAVKLRDEFPETAGLQCIGVSDAHIIALLRSDIIDYVIPYHVSGLNADLRRMADIYGWDDYTGTQHAAIDKSIKKENAADPEHWHEEPIFSEFFVGYNTGMSGIKAMRASAERYKQMCKDRGLTPKFNQFANEANYWKLLIDRKMINQQTGNLIRQNAVTPTFDFNTIKRVVDRYVDNYDSGLEARALNHIVENWDSIPKHIKDLKKQGGTKVKKTKKAIGTLANQTLAAQPSAKKLSDRDNAPTPSDDIRFQDRSEDSVSNRSLLANAFEGIAKHDERELVEKYKANVENANNAQARLNALNQKIKELSFAKGKRDTEKIEELRKTAKDLANLVSKYDKVLLKLEASQPLQDVLSREKKLAYKKAEEKGEKALAEYKAKAEARQKETAEKWRESREKGIESRRKTALRHKIKDVVNDLDQLLRKGTKDRHVPIGLQKAVAEALSAVNMDTVGAENRIANLEAEIAELEQKQLDAKTTKEIRALNQTIDALRQRIDNVREMGGKMDEKLQKLKTAYDEFINSDDPMIANSHDDAISAHLMTLIVRVGNTPLREMTLSQLQDVYDVYKIVQSVIRNANKSFKDAKNRDISIRANQVMAEVEKVGGKRDYRHPFVNFASKFDWANLKPVYAMERIGSDTLIDAFNNVRAGEDIWAKDITEARRYYLEKSKKYEYDSWDFEKRFKFESTSGMEFELTLDQIMSLYAYSKRNQAEDHLKYGGIVFDPKTQVVKKTKSGIKVKFDVTNATSYNISPNTLTDITSILTDDQKNFVDEMQTYLSDVMGAKGNEVSLAMYDVKLFRDKNYFPLKSAHQYMAKAREQAEGKVKIKNAGFSKETKPHAKNPIVLSSFMDVWANHVNEMSMYHAFTLSMEDFYRIYNYTTPSNNENLPVEGVNPSIENAYGAAATGYINQLLDDLNGGTRSDPRETLGKSMTAMFKKAKVFASLSVVIQQPSAIGRAFALVDPKYFRLTKDGMNHAELWGELKRYAPVAVIKEMGYFDTNMGKSTLDFIKAKEYSSIKEKAKALFVDGGYRDEILSKAPALADELTWCAIWNAVKRETVAKHKDLRPGSEEFLEAAGQRFTEVVTKTQVYDSVLARSANMRSKGGMMSMVTSFMAEPTTTINMLEDAIRKSKRGDKRYAARAFASVATSVILNNALVSLVYGMRDDDEDETFVEKYMQSFVSGMLDDINPLTYYPVLKDMWSVLQGYDVERSDMSLFSDLANAMKGLVKGYTSEDGDIADAWWTVAGAVANIGGIPMQNVRRDINGVINLIKTLAADFGGRETTWGSMADSLGDTVKNSLPVVGWLPGETKTDKLYDAIISGDTAYVDRLKGSYKNEDAFHSAVRKALCENDPRIREAAVAGYNGNPSERVRIAKLIIADGFDQDDVVVAINTEINKMEPDEDTTPKKKGFYTTEDFSTEIANGDQAAANAAKADIIDTAQKNGKTEEEAENSFVSSAKSNMKKLFLTGELSEDKAVNALIDFCGESEEDAEVIVAKWQFESKYDFTYSDRKQQFMDGNISAAEIKTTLMNVEGKTEKEANSVIVSYCRDAYNDGYWDRNKTASTMVTYGGLTREEAESKLRYIDVKKQFPDTYVDDAWVDEYYSEVKSSGIPIKVFIEYRNKVKSITGESKKEKRMAVINSLPITRSQKDALYYAEGWTKSKINEAPWH